MEASLYLIAVQTGARAITVSSMLLSDIMRVTISEETKKILCTLRYNRTKGSSTWGHEVTIEGDEEKEDDGDAVFWFSKYLKKSTGVKLSEWMEKSNAVDKSKPVWPLSTDAMRERFKERAKNAGYPRSLFSFHSLRSGFICSALIKSKSDPQAQKAVLESTALIAGWVPYRLAQMGYIKKVARRALASTRLLSETEDGAQPDMDRTLFGLEAFHGIFFKNFEERNKDPYKEFMKEKKKE
ncbi:uncharacterized protein MONOS_3954 [Monocercomonoides exilis]|uniref:uncharacterized protein n=1 Tax=Monocercomonoides exilis TaxID=2049356 RepID=UPI00355967F8|nr:hypothetical protein MONOS_3954 [Monocercomonoides exilis]|eukprot:MONOS_3954.1-p1 / transcript=MONOS_3954.1 / gene=MONOS_3954 / organism=Monocercomonoides_exilis_PA203 / gene_product=unspecified product / transcript_product=unspecified product / location=Mono_scaffold00098:127616-128335(+) / protein_length=240 / sequence_SO=supercontig / SO=protein_coding / is_pseudo=false